MKIDVLDISVKNFLSYGNGENSYTFQKGLDIIIAQNGAGKSSITLDALLFGFYGRPYRKIKLSSLQNNINTKNLEVIINFKKNNDFYRIQRGLNPSIFKIFKNNELIDETANVKDYQKILEENILETSEKTFRNLIVLGGIGISSGFMNLSAAEKEELISNIIDIKIINLLLEKIKDKSNNFKTQETELRYKYDVISNIIKNEAEKLRNLKDSIKSNNNENLEKINILKDKLKDYDNVKNDYYDLSSKISKLTEAKQKLRNSINLAENDKQIFNNSSFECVECGKVNNISNFDIEEIELRLVSLVAKLAKVDESLTLLYAKEANCKEILTNLESYKQELSFLESSKNDNISNEFLEATKNEIIARKDELNKIKESLSFVVSEINKYKEMTELLGKNNIKKFIINQQIPFLNKEINEFLQLFFTNYSFYFDSNLKDKVYYKNLEQDYNQLSNGQKIRICFAIMFAFIRFLEQKNGTQWNILVLDEILDNSLDSDGVESLLNIIRTEFNNKNIILVSHNDEIKNLDIFNRKVTIQRNIFSKISFENLDSLSLV